MLVRTKNASNEQNNLRQKARIKKKKFEIFHRTQNFSEKNSKTSYKFKKKKILGRTKNFRPKFFLFVNYLQ